VDETYIKVKGQWKYLYRAVDSKGNTLDFLLSAKRDAAAAERFLKRSGHTLRPQEWSTWIRMPPIRLLLMSLKPMNN